MAPESSSKPLPSPPSKKILLLSFLPPSITIENPNNAGRQPSWFLFCACRYPGSEFRHFPKWACDRRGSVTEQIKDVAKSCWALSPWFYQWSCLAYTELRHINWERRTLLLFLSTKTKKNKKKTSEKRWKAMCGYELGRQTWIEAPSLAIYQLWEPGWVICLSPVQSVKWGQWWCLPPPPRETTEHWAQPLAQSKHSNMKHSNDD